MTIQNNAFAANGEALPEGFEKSVLANAKRNARVVKLWNEGMTFTGIGREMGMTRDAVTGVVSRARKNGEQVRSATKRADKLSAGDRARVLELWNQGLSRKEIATAIGKAESHMNGVIQRAQLDGNAAKRDKKVAQVASKQRMEKRVEAVKKVQETGGVLVLSVPDEASEKAKKGLTLEAESLKACGAESREKEITGSVPTPLLKLRSAQCHWPLWNDDVNARPKLFCGAPRDEHDRCYCTAHMKVARRAAKPMPEIAQEDAKRKRAMAVMVRKFMQARRVAA